MTTQQDREREMRRDINELQEQMAKLNPHTAAPLIDSLGDRIEELEAKSRAQVSRWCVITGLYRIRPWMEAEELGRLITSMDRPDEFWDREMTLREWAIELGMDPERGDHSEYYEQSLAYL
jgi:hypothetical protein